VCLYVNWQIIHEPSCLSLQLKLEESLQNMEQLTEKMTEDKEREKEQTKLVGLTVMVSCLNS
jgi:hypothetical protein